MRAVVSAAMAALVILVLLAGNCLSCPQMLLAMATHQPSHGCCPHGKTPKTPECASQSLRHFVKAQSAPPAILAVAGCAVVLQFETVAAASALPLAGLSPTSAIPIRI